MTAPAVQHARGLLNRSTVILLPHVTDAALLPTEPLTTAVTPAELSVGPLVASSEDGRAARQAHLQQAEADFEPLPFDAQAARAFGRVAASLRRAGRKTSARAYDAMIAATALANHLPVYTCNPNDFSGIDGLDVVAVPIPHRLAVSIEAVRATPDERRRPLRRKPSKKHQR
jgi:predicted nucleic acid-binding protein